MSTVGSSGAMVMTIENSSKVVMTIENGLKVVMTTENGSKVVMTIENGLKVVMTTKVVMVGRGSFLSRRRPVSELLRDDLKFYVEPHFN